MRYFLTGIIVLSATAALRAQSSDSARRAAAELEEVTVTDGHVSRAKRENTLNIEIVNQEYIRRNLGGSLMKSLEKLPGIKSIGIGSGNSKPLIRGLGFNQVVVVENGIRHEGQQWGADHGLEIDQYAAGEVEIIKGPAAFLYGSDAIAGAIHIKSAPIPEPHGSGASVELTGKSNNDQWAVSGHFFTRSNKWFFSTRITATDYGDFRVPADTVYVYSYAAPLHDRFVRNTAGNERNLHLRTGWIGKKAETVFYASRIYNKSGFFANAHGLEPRRVNMELHDRSSRDIQLPYQEVTHHKLINKTVFHLSGHRLAWQSGFQKNFRQEWNQYVNHGYMPPVYPSEKKTPSSLEREYDKTVFSTQLKDEWTMGRHQLAAGASAEHQRNKIEGWSFLIPAFSQIQAAAFVYDKIRLNRDLVAHAALRYDYGRININRYSDWFPSTIVVENDTTRQFLVRSDNVARNFSSVTWSAGLSYESGKMVLKGNIGSSFRMPIAKELGANGVNYHYFRYERGDANLSAERSYQLDLGIGWNEPEWSVLISPYLNYFPNFIYLNPTSSHDYFYGAGNQVFEYAESRVLRYGAEIQAHYRFSPKWDADLAAEYLYNEQLSGSKKGYTLPFTPPASLLLSVQYELPDAGKISGSYIGVNGRATASQPRIVPPERKTPGYRLFGFSAGTTLNLKEQPLNFSLQMQNLLNTRYLNHTSFYRLIALPEAGRNIVLSVHVPLFSKKNETVPSTAYTKHR